jgi:CHAT domain-containing protein
VFDARSTHRSGLVVEPDDGEADPLGARHRYGTTDLALFTAAQVVGRLFLSRCELAVLAACNSGLPRQHDASEFTGLPGAFLVAGARNVVASLWPAHDGAAALLMANFYTALGDGSSRVQVAAALAAARSSLAGLSRADVVARLGEGGIPAGDRPFAASLYTDCFQHYGVD